MDISAAALPPIQPHISEQDRKHHRFGAYQDYRSGMCRLLVEADSFKDWLNKSDFNDMCDSWVAHPRYKEFMKWMVENQGGARKTYGAFPTNFIAWLDGKRW